MTLRTFINAVTISTLGLFCSPGEFANAQPLIPVGTRNHILLLDIENRVVESKTEFDSQYRLGGQIVEFNEAFYGVGFGDWKTAEFGQEDAVIWKMPKAEKSFEFPHSFLHPFGLHIDSLIELDGTLYGTTATMISDNVGELWSYEIESQSIEILHEFPFGQSPLPFPTGDIAVSDGVIYGTDAGELWLYDPAASEWEALAELPSDGFGPALPLEFFGTKIIGGAASGSLWTYDLNSGLFETDLVSLVYGELAGFESHGSKLLLATQEQDVFDGTLGNAIWSLELESGERTLLHDFGEERPASIWMLDELALVHTQKSGGDKFHLIHPDNGLVASFVPEPRSNLGLALGLLLLCRFWRGRFAIRVSH